MFPDPVDSAKLNAELHALMSRLQTLESANHDLSPLMQEARVRIRASQEQFNATYAQTMTDIRQRFDAVDRQVKDTRAKLDQLKRDQPTAETPSEPTTQAPPELDAGLHQTLRQELLARYGTTPGKTEDESGAGSIASHWSQFE